MNEPLVGFSPEAFARRRTRVQGALAGGAMILPSAPVLKRSRDTEHRYRADSELFYLTGITQPDIVAVVRDREEKGYVLFVPPKDPDAERWSGPRPGPEAAKELFGADEVYPLSELAEKLTDLLRPHSRVFFRLGVHAKLEKVVLEVLGWARGKGARTGEGPRGVVDPGEVLDDLRLVKDQEEIARVREATRVTVSAFRDALGATRPGLGEWEVEALLESSFRKRGATGPAFPTIVGSGKNACTLHYVENGDSIRDGQLVLLDGGAEWGLYSGDITRTFPAGGKFSTPQAEVYRVVLNAHAAAISRVRPGGLVADVHTAAVEALTQGLIDLGVLQGRVEDLMVEEAHKPFFPHQTSHWLGLDVHDPGDYSTGAGPRILEAGMVLTVEPGLYFPQKLEGPAASLEGVGIRVEDDLLVTDDGSENLTDSLPVTQEEVERLVGSDLRE
jgi:Xaa-Pro aminopeptidase